VDDLNLANLPMLPADLAAEARLRALEGAGRCPDGTSRNRTAGPADAADDGPAASGEGSRRGLEAARGFEAVLLYRLMEAMQRTVPDSGLLSSPVARQMEGLFWFYLSHEVARRGGLGLWKDLARSLGLQADGSDPAPDTEGPQA